MNWYDRGIPLSCVLRGIRTAYYEKISGEEYSPEEDEIRSLSWCRWAVQREWKEYRSVEVQPDEVEERQHLGAGQEVGTVLGSLLYDLSYAQKVAESRALEELLTELQSLERELAGMSEGIGVREADIEELESGLQALDERMVASAHRFIEPEVMKKIEKSVERKLSRNASGMKPEVLESTRKAAIESRVRQGLALPYLTLYNL